LLLLIATTTDSVDFRLVILTVAVADSPNSIVDLLKDEIVNDSPPGVGVGDGVGVDELPPLAQAISKLHNITTNSGQSNLNFL
jgi:hypothetical protein